MMGGGTEGVGWEAGVWFENLDDDRKVVGSLPRASECGMD